MKIDIQRSDERGTADFGWLKAKYSFSFANYYNPKRIHFGALRVLNDDIVDPGMGFGSHPHDNMEIITIPMEGALEHKDSMGNTGVITKGEVQVMSAGSGIFHSEYNHSKTERVAVLQIWVMTKSKDIEPRYDQKKFDPAGRENKWQQIVNPMNETEGLQINQDAWFLLGRFDGNSKSSYELKNPNSGVYVFVVDGNITVNGQVLNKRDSAGITETDKLDFSFQGKAEVLVMEIPMRF